MRARNTSSRSHSLRNRTMIARVRGRPSLSTRRPRRWLRSRSCSCSGGVIPSLPFAMSRTFSSVSSPCSTAGIPSNRRFGRRVYCSSESFASASSWTSLSRLVILATFSSTAQSKSLVSSVKGYTVALPLSYTHNLTFVRCLLLQDGFHLLSS